MDLNLTNNTFSKVRMELRIAAGGGDVQRVKQLLDEGADVNEKAPYYETTPVMFSVMYRHLKVTQLLLEAGADISVIHHTGGRAIPYAIQNCDIPMMRLLLKYGDTIGLQEKWCWNRLRDCGFIEEAKQTMAWNKRSSMVSLRNHLLNLD